MHRFCCMEGYVANDIEHNYECDNCKYRKDYYQSGRTWQQTGIDEKIAKRCYKDQASFIDIDIIWLFLNKNLKLIKTVKRKLNIF